MAIETFDDFLSTEYGSGNNDKPFQFRDEPNSEKHTLQWLNNNFDLLEQRAQSRIRVYRNYVSMYKNVQWRNYNFRDARTDDITSERKPRHSVNFVEEMVEGRVSQGAQTKVGFAAIPNNYEEQDDINNAKACKMLLQNRCEMMDFDQIQQEADRTKFLMGNSFSYVYWDPEAGDLNPEYVKAKNKGVKIPKLDKNGNVIPGKYIEGEIRIGDVCICIYGPDRVFPEIGKYKWGEVNHVDIITWVHIEELKKMYPKKAAEIKENQNKLYYDYDLGELSKPEKMVCVREFWHKKTKWLPEGAYIKYTDDVILEWGPHKYDHGELPFVVDSDIEVYGELWGRSFISNIEQMQKFYNILQSGIARDLGVGAAPKWVMPKGSASVNALNNEFAVIEFTGPVAPQLLSYRPVSDQSIVIQDRLEKKIAQKSTIYDISRGEVPAGVTANSALRFLDEQETRRASPLISKRKSRIIKTLRMMLQLMKQYYKESDGRMVRTLGRDNEYLIRSFKKADFNSVSDIKLENSSALPDTKTGKISTIVDLNTATQTDPIFRKEDIVQMLDLGLDKGFTENATVALTAAKTILEDILEGNPVPEPQAYDNLLVHYDVFYKYIQTMAYRTKVPPQVKAVIEQRILTIEGLMYIHCRKNMKFLTEVMQLSHYPIYFEPEIPLVQLAQMMQTPIQPEAPSPAADTTKVTNLTTQQGAIDNANSTGEPQ